MRLQLLKLSFRANEQTSERITRPVALPRPLLEIISHSNFISGKKPLEQAVREAATLFPRPDLESGVRVTCDVGYIICANFSLPMSLCSRLRPDVRDRQRDVTQTDVRRQTCIIA